MNLNWHRLRRAIWTYRQPLTRIPKRRAPVSDLFLWRKADNWSTVFELINLPALITGDISASSPVTLVLFSNSGKLVSSITLNLQGKLRQQILLDDVVTAEAGDYGTFAVFHEAIPEPLDAVGSFLAERGYTGYRYNDAPLLSYVHGNLDAICKDEAGQFCYLESDSFLPRNYILQYQFDQHKENELALVNASATRKKVTIYFEHAATGELLEKTVKTLPAGGCVLVDCRHVSNEPFHARIKSRLVMARPLVFSGNQQFMDAFHG